jgi:hypothetical protein
MDSRKITDRERSRKMITTVPTYPVQCAVDYPDRDVPVHMTGESHGHGAGQRLE